MSDSPARRGRSERSEEEKKRSKSKAPRSNSKAPPGSRSAASSSKNTAPKLKHTPNASKSVASGAIQPKTRRDSTSSGERAMFPMSDGSNPPSSSSPSSSSTSSRGNQQTQPRRSDVGDGLGAFARYMGSISLSESSGSGNGFASGSDSSNGSSGSWAPTAAAAPRTAPPTSRFFGGGGSSGSSDPSSGSAQPVPGSGGGSGSGGFFESQSSGSGQSAPATGYVDPNRRRIIHDAHNFPGSGHSPEYKRATEATTGQSYDSWKSDASVRGRYEGVKAGEESWQRHAQEYNDGLDNTPEGRRSQGATGSSHPGINKDLTKDQHKRHGTKAHNAAKSVSHTADLRVEMNAQEPKSMMKKGLMTGHNSVAGHATRVSVLERNESEYQELAEEHYRRGGSSQAGVPTAEVERARRERAAVAQSQPPLPGPEGSAYEYGDRLRRDGHATTSQLEAAGWNTQVGYTDTTAPAPAAGSSSSASASRPPISSRHRDARQSERRTRDKSQTRRSQDRSQTRR